LPSSARDVRLHEATRFSCRQLLKIGYGLLCLAQALLGERNPSGEPDVIVVMQLAAFGDSAYARVQAFLPSAESLEGVCAD
jgi:hypothetical protein